MTDFSDTLLAWHKDHGRHHLPWQGTTDPYAIWISEIMLQQTQVSTVIPYYERFMARFPTIKTLAEADIDAVLHLWTGLGYYARGRNLHTAAQQIQREFQGSFPKTLDEVMSLRGIGRSTAGAILSFAFSLRHPILDANVKRVLSRVFGIEGWYGKKTVADQFWQLAEQHTPKKNVATYTQAIMDFGATLCTRSKPHCNNCPFQKTCIAFKQDRINELPSKKSKKKKPVKSCVMLIIRNEAINKNKILLEQRPPTGIWGGLWTLPQIDTTDISNQTDIDISSACEKHYGFGITITNRIDTFRHTFSHYHLDITPLFAGTLNEQIQTNEKTYQWVNLDQTLQIGLPAPIKKLLKSI